MPLLQQKTPQSRASCTEVAINLSMRKHASQSDDGSEIGSFLYPNGQGADSDDEPENSSNVIDLDAQNLGDLESVMKAVSHAMPVPVDEEDAESDKPVDMDVKSPEPKETEESAGSQAVAAAALDQIKSLEAQVEQERSNTLRAIADLQNSRRRAENEKRRLVTEANERLVKEVLPAVDDFERALLAAKEAQSYEQLVGGVEALLRKLHDTLARQGVEPIETVGQPFDPEIHEAVMVDYDADAPDETVVQELLKGYMFHGRVLRPALVKVAKSG